MTQNELHDLYLAIDEKGISAFISAIHAASSDGSISTLELVNALDGIVMGFLQEGRNMLTRSEGLSAEEKSRITVHGLITAAEMMILCDSCATVSLGEKSRIFLELSSAVVSTDYPFLETALKTLDRDIVSVGFTWPVLERSVSLDIPTYHFCSSVKFSKAAKSFLYSGKGIAECRDGVLSLLSADVKGNPSKAFGVFSDKIEVVTRKMNGERLKSSDREVAQALFDFAQTYLETLSESRQAETKKKRLEDGDIVDIECYYGDDGEPLFMVVDDESELSGPLREEELIRGFYTHDLLDYIAPGDCIRNAELILDGSEAEFSIRDTYERFCRGRAESDLRSGIVFQARALRVLDGIQRVNWLTVRGFGGVSILSGEEQVGQVMSLEVDSIKDTRGFFINLRRPKYDNDQSVVRFAEGEDEGYDVLSEFVCSRRALLLDRKKASEEKAIVPTEVKTLNSLARIIFNRASSVGSMEKCYRLLTALFLAKMTDDGALMSSVWPPLAHLLHLLAFARNQELSIPRGLAGTTGNEQGVLRCLEMMSPDSAREELLAFAASDDGILRDCASLILAWQTAQDYRDEVHVENDAVRERICHLLGVSDLFAKSEAGRAGKYGSTEHGNIEFKSSYVFRNDKKQPVADIFYQGRGQVFEAVCAFLNTNEGGVVYVGVKDNGNPIMDDNWGIQADIKWLGDNYDRISRDRFAILRHGITKVEDVDSMSRFLQNEKELYFKESVQDLIEIEATEDMDAIRITVKPSQYEIAYLYENSKEFKGGIAFKRSGSSSLPMTDHDKRMRLLELKDISREMGFVVTIREAIDKHQKLMFKNYSSSNSAKVQDRLVVPINLFYNDENVYCYDLATKTYKQFRLHRIESIEKLDDFYTLPLRPARDCDVFRWLDEGKGKYHIRLRMKVAAKNYLFEEYSCAEKLPEEQLRKDGRDHWILDTTLYGLGAVRRFYLGLADQIEILDSEDKEKLLKEIRRFVASNITNQPDEDSVQ